MKFNHRFCKNLDFHLYHFFVKIVIIMSKGNPEEKFGQIVFQLHFSQANQPFVFFVNFFETITNSISISISMVIYSLSQQIYSQARPPQGN